MFFDIPVKHNPTIELRMAPAGTTAGKINKEARTIDDVILVSVGEAKGHGFSIEAGFLTDMMKYVKKSMGGRVQCNMGHRWDANFFQLGRFDKLRLSDDGRSIIGNLSVYEAADASPALAGMASWFMQLADEDVKAVMCSIKFEPGGYYQYDDKGNKVYVQWSWWSGPAKQFKDKPVYVEFKALRSCDIVDEGALTDSLFSEGSNAPYTFAQIVNAPGFTEFLRENEQHFPQLQAYMNDRQESGVVGFFKKFFSNNTKDMSTEKTPATAGSATPAPDQPATPAAPATEQASAAAPAVQDVNALIEAALKPLRDQVTGLQQQLTAKDARIAELEKQPAAEGTKVKDENPATVTPADKNLWDENPINQMARKIARPAKV